jgi:hypothetical protein
MYGVGSETTKQYIMKEKHVRYNSAVHTETLSTYIMKATQFIMMNSTI